MSSTTGLQTALPVDRVRRARNLLIATVPLVLAVTATQHHTLHMLILAFGVGAGGMSFLDVYPAIRRVMLIVSLGAAGVAGYRAIRHARSRALNTLSVATTLLLVGRSVGEFGL
jgi:hypothetical protein